MKVKNCSVSVVTLNLSCANDPLIKMSLEQNLEIFYPLVPQFSIGPGPIPTPNRHWDNVPTGYDGLRRICKIIGRGASLFCEISTTVNFSMHVSHFN